MWCGWKCWLLFVWKSREEKFQLLYIFYCIVVKFYRFLSSFFLFTQLIPLLNFTIFDSLSISSHLICYRHAIFGGCLHLIFPILFVILSTLHNPPFDHLNHEQASEKRRLSYRYFLYHNFIHFTLNLILHSNKKKRNFPSIDKNLFEKKPRNFL
jgi:hypothetical protein